MATSDTPSLHTALQREREALLRLMRGKPHSADVMNRVRQAMQATDQALAALETRPTLAEVEAAVEDARHAMGGRRESAALDRVLNYLRALYGRGWVE